MQSRVWPSALVALRRVRRRPVSDVVNSGGAQRADGGGRRGHRRAAPLERAAQPHGAPSLCLLPRGFAAAAPPVNGALPVCGGQKERRSGVTLPWPFSILLDTQSSFI
jgi:hypothetical protein